MKFERAMRRGLLTAALVGGLGLVAAPAEAGYIATMTESGGNVVVVGSGTLDLAGLSSDGTVGLFAQIIANQAGLVVGAATGAGSITADNYTGIAGPASFGGGGQATASSGTGDVTAVLGGAGSNRLMVPEGYVSGAALAGTATWLGASYASLGVTPGTYTWTWGGGLTPGDSFTLNIEATAVPEPSSMALLLGPLGLLGLALVGRRRRSPGASPA